MTNPEWAHTCTQRSGIPAADRVWEIKSGFGLKPTALLIWQEDPMEKKRSPESHNIAKILSQHTWDQQTETEEKKTYKPWQVWIVRKSVCSWGLKPFLRASRDFIWGEGRLGFLHSLILTLSISLCFFFFLFFAPASTSRSSQTKCFFKKLKERQKRAGSWKAWAFAFGSWKERNVTRKQKRHQQTTKAKTDRKLLRRTAGLLFDCFFVF